MEPTSALKASPIGELRGLSLASRLKISIVTPKLGGSFEYTSDSSGLLIGDEILSFLSLIGQFVAFVSLTELDYVHL